MDDTVIYKLCDIKNQPEKYEECIKAKENAIEESVLRGNSIDDLKSARGDIYNALKVILNLSKCGNNADAFVRDTMAPLITEDMDVYKKLEGDIFGQE